MIPKSPLGLLITNEYKGPIFPYTYSAVYGGLQISLVKKMNRVGTSLHHCPCTLIQIGSGDLISNFLTHVLEDSCGTRAGSAEEVLKFTWVPKDYENLETGQITLK